MVYYFLTGRVFHLRLYLESCREVYNGLGEEGMDLRQEIEKSFFSSESEGSGCHTEQVTCRSVHVTVTEGRGSPRLTRWFSPSR